MTTDPPPIRAEIEAFWDFSLAHYCREEVEQLCLALQDEHGFDVNLVLLELWIADGWQASLDVDEIQRLRQAIALWSASIVEPLRRIRRLLKFPDHFAVADGEAELCREMVKSAEIEAERIAQHLLVRALDIGETARQPSAADAADASFAAYVEVLAAPAAKGELGRLRDAIFSPSASDSPPAVLPPA